MSNELHFWAAKRNLAMVKELVEGGANIEEIDNEGKTALLLASHSAAKPSLRPNNFEIVRYLVKCGANVAHSDRNSMTALHWACFDGNAQTVKCLIKHGARVTERDKTGMTALLNAACDGSLEVVQYLLSSEGGASISETDDDGNTALLCAGMRSKFSIVQWLLEYGGAQITDVNNEERSLWTRSQRRDCSVGVLLRHAYENKKGKHVFINGKFVPCKYILEVKAMLRVMVLHGAPPESVAEGLAPPLQRIVQDGARLRAWLPSYLTQRRAVVDAHCPLLPPLRDLVRGYEEPTTTDELWATELGAPQ
jgi:hypothetical protein